MKIESIIQRPGGSVISIGEETYHFQPTKEDERHQAEVTVESHIARFLGITEGFRELDGEPREESEIKTSQVHASIFTLADDSTITLAELTSRAFSASGLGVAEWNALEPDDLYEQIDVTLSEINDELNNVVKPQPSIDADAPKDEEVVEAEAKQDEPEVEAEKPELDRAALIAEYRALFGKKPHHTQSAERIKQLIDENK